METTQTQRVLTVQSAPIKLYLFIIVAGLIDIVTSLVGVNFSSLYEVNVINATLNFPVGVLIWVTYFCFFIYIISHGKYTVKNEKEKQGIIEMVKYLPIFLACLSFLIPVHNLILIMGGGLI